jgi:predicted MPP superfamily phosphohydrolase
LFWLIIGSMLGADLLWWRWADRRVRGRGRGALAAFMGAQTLYIASYAVVPDLARRSHEFLPAFVIACGLLWHLGVLPAALLWAFGNRVAALFRRRAPAPAEGDPVTRRRFLGALAAATPPLVTGLTVGLALRSIHSFRLRRFRIGLPALPPALDGLTITHVSDLHAGKFTDAAMLDRVVEQVNALRSDLVLFTGDLIDLSLVDLEDGMETIRRFDPGQGLFLCEGNHDRIDDGPEFVRRVRAAGLPLLRDETATVRVRGVPVQILGARWTRGDESTQKAVEDLAASVRPGAFPILLAHHPHAFDPADRAGLPLTLSGHTHGGQLMLNEKMGAGPVLFRYWSGLYKKGENALVVSNGVGNWFPLRTAAPAEIVHLTLHRGV